MTHIYRPNRPTRHDGWQNQVTGIGLASVDKTQSAVAVFIPLQRHYLTQLYNTDHLAARIVDSLPDDALRRRPVLHVEGAPEADSALARRMRELQVRDRLRYAGKMSRLTGGALVVLITSDAAPMSEPMTPGARLTDIRVTYPDYVAPVPRRDGSIIEPERYRVLGAGLDSIVHASRVVRLHGHATDHDTMAHLGGWDLSVLQRVADVIRDDAQFWRSLVSLTVDASQGVLKMQGLRNALASGRQEYLSARMAAFDMTRSVMRSIALDVDESFERVATSFAGLPELADRMMQRIASAAEMPLTKLMGRSPGGLNATGESDTRGWYDAVDAYRENELEPALVRIGELLAAELGVEGDVAVEWPPLWTPTELERATLRAQIGQTDVAYITAGVLEPDEVALARFRPGGYSAETELLTRAAREREIAGWDGEEPEAEPAPMAPPVTSDDPEADGGPLP